MQIKVNQVAGGRRNLTLHITGSLKTGEQIVAYPIPVDSEESGLKLTGAVWIVQEKLGINVLWSITEILLPMESRNSIRLDSGIRHPEKWDRKLYLASFNEQEKPGPKSFFIVLDFDR